MYDVKTDLEELLEGFKWEVVGLLLEDQSVIDVPSDSRAISAIFEQLVVERIKPIAQEKWRIASRRTGSGTTKHMRSITNVEDLKAGRGEFRSQEEFLEYWRSY